MNAVRVTCDTGRTWVSSINGTEQEAHDYFLGLVVTLEDPGTGEEIVHKITRVETLGEWL